MPHIYIDADGCPVKDEVYRVAERYSLKVTLVANHAMRHPQKDWIDMQVVRDLFDAADDWIAETVADGDIVISGDIPLAGRCLERGALVLDPRGKIHDEESIGAALGNRELFSHLRDLGMLGGGPKPFDQRDRSRFLERLDQLVHAARRRRR